MNVEENSRGEIMDKELIEKIAIGSKPYLWKFTDEYKFAALILSLIHSAGYVKLADDQTPPEIYRNENHKLFCDGEEWMQQDMLTPHKEGERMVAFRRVIL